MDLIIVDRYLEDETPNQGDTILKQLHRQAQQRKILKDGHLQSKRRTEGAPNRLSKNKKKRPRHKNRNHIDDCSQTDTSGAVKRMKIAATTEATTEEQQPDPKKTVVKTDVNVALPHIVDEGVSCNSLVSAKRKRRRRFNKPQHAADPFQTYSGTVMESVKIDTENGINKEGQQPDQNEKVVTVSKGINEIGHPTDINEPALHTHRNIEDDFTIIGDLEEPKPQKVKKVIPEWMLEPIFISTDLKKKLVKVSKFPGLLPSLVLLLKTNGIKRLFPVQKEVMSFMFESFCKNWVRPRDVCVCAPTGSGKTLAYVLPIIQALHGRVVCNIKALIVLPVTDLAIQVYEVFLTYCKGSGLQVGLAVGQMLLHEEQATLVRKGYSQFHSLVDILVCTPGRLVDHIKNTQGFSLKGLRFLVIDEADRILQFIKQNWLEHVVDSFNSTRESSGSIPLVASKMGEHQDMLWKLLFTATLTHNPEKLEQLDLFQPKLFTAVASSSNLDDDCCDKYTTPRELTEFYVISDIPLKPLIILHFIHTLKYRYLLIFTNTVENSHRLYLLLSAFGGVVVREFSSNLPLRARKKILTEFSRGLVDVIVCSDGMARGMDVENAQYVISYDFPPYVKTYIHRVGRTARAGRHGTAVLLVLPVQVSILKKMMKNVNRSSLSEIKIETGDLMPLEEQYRSALSQISQIVTEEHVKKVRGKKPRVKSKSRP